MRPSWDEYFLDVARTVATRGTCPRASVGSVFARNERILSTGYNGAPPNAAHCVDVGCVMVNGHCMRTTHAEANAIAQAARHGVSLAGSTAYATYQPCLSCTKLLISAGVARIVYGHAYPDELAAKLLTEVGIPVLYLTSFDALPPGSEAKSSP